MFGGGDVGIEVVVAGVAEGGAEADAGFADEDDVRARVATGSDDGGDVGAGFLFGQALQEVVAADADDDEARVVFPQQWRQAGQGTAAGVAALSGVDDVPAAHGSEAGRVGFVRVGAEAVGQGIAEGEDGAAAR